MTEDKSSNAEMNSQELQSKQSPISSVEKIVSVSESAVSETDSTIKQQTSDVLATGSEQSKTPVYCPPVVCKTALAPGP